MIIFNLSSNKFKSTKVFPPKVFHPNTHCGWLTKSTKRLTMRRKCKNLGSKGRWASASHWLQHRRAAVRKACSDKGDKGPSRKVMISKMASRMWGAKQEKEMQFNKKKENKRRALNQFKFCFSCPFPSKENCQDMG